MAGHGLMPTANDVLQFAIGRGIPGVNWMVSLEHAAGVLHTLGRYVELFVLST